MLDKLEELERTSLQRLSEALVAFEVGEDAARTVRERNTQWAGSTWGTIMATWGILLTVVAFACGFINISFGLG